jgi:uncharacterized membrane protein HdeD (DUF308 family)
MSSHTLTANDLSGGGEINVRGWAIFSGITLLILGTAALFYQFTATIASVVLFGWLLTLSGAMQVVHSFQVRTWSGFFLYLIDGILRATVGTLLVVYPGSGAEALTLVLAFYFIAGGLLKAIASSSLQFPGWGWSVASGLISIVLGALLMSNWQATSPWFIGFAVGIDLIMYGWALLMFASAIKKVSTTF